MSWSTPLFNFPSVIVFSFFFAFWSFQMYCPLMLLSFFTVILVTFDAGWLEFELEPFFLFSSSVRDPGYFILLFCFAFLFSLFYHLGFSGFVMFTWGKVVSFIDIWSFLNFTFRRFFSFCLFLGFGRWAYGLVRVCKYLNFVLAQFWWTFLLLSLETRVFFFFKFRKQLSIW